MKKKRDGKPIPLIVGFVILIAAALLLLMALESRTPDFESFQGPADYESPTTPPPGFKI